MKDAVSMNFVPEQEDQKTKIVFIREIQMKEKKTDIKTKWIFETGCLWSCPTCKHLIVSSEEKLIMFHRYCGVCGKKMIKEDPDESY